MRKLFSICLLLVGWLGAAWGAETTFKLTDGTSVTGSPLVSAANENGILLKSGEDQFTRVSWGKFSQEDLKAFLKDKKLTTFIEPFIEISKEQRREKTTIAVKEVVTLPRPVPTSMVGSLFKSGLGWFIVAMLYGANLFAGYEVAVFRARSPLLVCGLAAVAPVLVPAIFLALPTQLPKAVEVSEPVLPEALQDGGGGYHVPLGGEAEAAAVAAHIEATGAPPVAADEVFAKGKYTFNKRFLETKFVNFFGTVRREEDRNRVLIVKTPREHFTASRISRITTNEVHFTLPKGGEVGVAFTDIHEITIRTLA